MNRFFVENDKITENKILITDKENIKHMSNVLRLQPNDLIEVSDGEKYEYVAQIMKVSKDNIECNIIESSAFIREPLRKVFLYQGIPKQSKMEYIIQKCVELGIYEVIPVFTERTVIHDKGNFNKKIERWQKISEEAAKQSKRGIIPKVHDSINFDEMLYKFKDIDLLLFLYENEEKISIKDVLKSWKKNETIALIIGPEGGFSEEEAERLRSLGAQFASLGKRILRTETAGAVALAITLYELEG